MNVKFRKQDGSNLIEEEVRVIYLPTDEGPIMWIGVDSAGEHDLIITVQDSTEVMTTNIDGNPGSLVLLDRNSTDSRVRALLNRLLPKRGED